MQVLSKTNFLQNEALNFVTENLITPPTNPVVGQIYFDINFDTIMCYNGTEWLDLAASAAGNENYNTLYNKPIINMIGTTSIPIDLSILGIGTYNISGYYTYTTNGTQYYSDNIFVIVFDPNSKTKRIIIGSNGAIVGSGMLNGDFYVNMNAEFVNSVACKSTTINGWTTKIIDDVLTEYYGG
jgi:hypothetical protein